jgi:formamidopyrimidine-DNA glycosylase
MGSAGRPAGALTMPELPEVETYARDLDHALRGRVLQGAWVGWAAQAPCNRPAALGGEVAGRTVLSVSRRGKYLVMELDRGWLIIHLKMSGRLVVEPSDEPARRHAHVIFRLDGGDELRFLDPRKFGRVYLVDDPAGVLGRLGPEPLGCELTAEAFSLRLTGRRRRLKPLLLDQEFLAGLGNIYVDESLWAARLHPLRPAASLGEAEARGLHAAIRDVLRLAIAARGTSLGDGSYRDLTGNPGEMQGSLAVYGRAGAKCLRCGGPIERITVGGRGTHLCPRCQPVWRGHDAPDGERCREP